MVQLDEKTREMIISELREIKNKETISGSEYVNGYYAAVNKTEELLKKYSEVKTNLFEMTGKIELDADEFEADIDRLIAKVEKLNEELSKLG